MSSQLNFSLFRRSCSRLVLPSPVLSHFQPQIFQQNSRQFATSILFFKQPDFYKILGVSSTADKKKIRKAFKNKSINCHPDKFPGDSKKETEFKVLSEAYQTLSDTDLRKKYDFNNRYGPGSTSSGSTSYNYQQSPNASSSTYDFERNRRYRAEAERRRQEFYGDRGFPFGNDAGAEERWKQMNEAYQAGAKRRQERWTQQSNQFNFSKTGGFNFNRPRSTGEINWPLMIIRVTFYYFAIVIILNMFLDRENYDNYLLQRNQDQQYINGLRRMQEDQRRRQQIAQNERQWWEKQTEDEKAAMRFAYQQRQLENQRAQEEAHLAELRRQEESRLQRELDQIEAKRATGIDPDRFGRGGPGSK